MPAERIWEPEPIWYLRSIPYYLYTQTAHWKIRREEYIEDVLYGSPVCERCGLRNLGFKYYRDGSSEIWYPVFNLHHLNYDHLGEELDEDLELLCAPCHNLDHNPESHAAKNWIRILQHERYMAQLASEAEQGL